MIRVLRRCPAGRPWHTPLLPGVADRAASADAARTGGGALAAGRATLGSTCLASSPPSAAAQLPPPRRARYTRVCRTDGCACTADSVAVGGCRAGAPRPPGSRCQRYNGHRDRGGRRRLCHGHDPAGAVRGVGFGVVADRRSPRAVDVCPPPAAAAAAGGGGRATARIRGACPCAGSATASPTPVVAAAPAAAATAATAAADA